MDERWADSSLLRCVGLYFKVYEFNNHHTYTHLALHRIQWEGQLHDSIWHKTMRHTLVLNVPSCSRWQMRTENRDSLVITGAKWPSLWLDWLCAVRQEHGMRVTWNYRCLHNRNKGVHVQVEMSSGRTLVESKTFDCLFWHFLIVYSQFSAVFEAWCLKEEARAGHVLSATMEGTSMATATRDSGAAEWCDTEYRIAHGWWQSPSLLAMQTCRNKRTQKKDEIHWARPADPLQQVK